MRRKEYAVSLGLATPGKGRMSREALEAVKKAEAGGMTFSDSHAVRSSPVASKTPVRVARDTGPVVAHDRSEHVMGITLRYDMDQMFEGFDSNGKKHTVNGRQTCTCGYSLVGHVCHDPSALIGFPLERIRVTPKKKG